MEIGKRPNAPFDLIDLQSLRSAYTVGRGIASHDLALERRGTGVTREKLLGAAHTADLLARAYRSIDPVKTAQWRGRADVFAEAAELLLDDRELAGCVDTCPSCSGTGQSAYNFEADRRLTCTNCGGAGLAYAPERLQQLVAGKGARHA